MISVFFYRGGILIKTSVSVKETITRIWHKDKCLKLLYEEWKNIHKKTGLKNFILHQDNARPHFGKEAEIFYQENSIKILKHLPYIPDLSPCNFWLFTKRYKI